MGYTYATQGMTERMAKAVRISAPISNKISAEIGRHIKGRYTDDALAILERAINFEQPIPIRRFNDNTAHKPGMGPGSYPVSTAKVFVELIKSVVANAADRSLNTKDLIIFSVVAQKGGKTYKYGRMRGIKAKNTHLEIVVAEKAREPKKVHKKRNTDTKVTQ